MTKALQIRHGLVTNCGTFVSAMSRRTQITLTDRQHAFLRDESSRTGLPIAELVRRAVDKTYRPHARRTVRGLELSLGVWRRPDAAVVGRRVRIAD